MRLLAVMVVLATPALASADRLRVDLSTGFEISDAFQRTDESDIIDDVEAGFSVGLLVTQRMGPFQAGGSLETVAGLLGADMVRVAFAGGVIADMGINQRFELLAEGGIGFFRDIGDGFSIESVDGESTARKIFLGGRAGYQHDIGNGSVAIGGWVTYRRDLGTSEHKVTVRDCFDFCTTEMRTYEVGGSHWGFTFAVTWTPGASRRPAVAP